MAKLYFITFSSALILSLLLTPASVVLARRFGALDPVDPRKIHNSPKPRWGGIAVIGSFFCSLLILGMYTPQFSNLLKYSKGISSKGKVLFTLNLGEQLAGILFGVLLLFIVGLFDDRKSIKSEVKLLFQIIAAYVAMTYGVRIYGLSVPGFEAYARFPLWFMQVVTLLWIVGMTNAVNLIDGLDGLAGGVVAIIAGSFVAVALIQEKTLTPFHNHQMKLVGIIASAVGGGVLGFLAFNSHPARVFMGDSGSLSLGFIVGCIAVTGAFKTTIVAVLLIPFLLGAVPMVDMTWAFGRRIMKRQNPFTADRGHFHHRLLDAGWTQREVVFLVYVLTLILALISVAIVGFKK